jgi:hypothetical protein
MVGQAALVVAVAWVVAVTVRVAVTFGVAVTAMVTVTFGDAVVVVAQPVMRSCGTDEVTAGQSSRTE